MKTLTIDALWAWAILAEHKTVENRSWKTDYRGPLAIHAGQNRSRDGEALRLLEQQGITPPDEDVRIDLRGKVLGVVTLVDVAAYSAGVFAADPFATGPFCWRMEGPRWLEESIPASGKLLLWECELSERTTAALTK